MRNICFCFLLFILIAAGGCEGPEVIHDLGNTRVQLLDQDSAAVQFPADFRGTRLVVGFIYTHCPDICPVTTANMRNALQQLRDTSDVHFVGITFDPARDTPAVLKQYMNNFRLPEQHFTMLTGDTAAIRTVLEQMDIKAAVSYRDTSAAGKPGYFMNHTDRISIMDSRGRVRFEYPGSVVPPEHIVEDLSKLR